MTLDEAFKDSIEHQLDKAYKEGYEAGLKHCDNFQEGYKVGMIDTWKAIQDVVCNMTTYELIHDVGLPDFPGTSHYEFMVMSRCKPDEVVSLFKNYWDSYLDQ